MVISSKWWEKVARRDRRLTEALRRWSPPRVVRLWMVSFSRAGDGWLWGLLGAGVLWAGGERRYQVLLTTTVAVVIAIAIFSLIKRIAVRSRPCELFPFSSFQKIPPDRFSFPSGHSVTAFAVTVPLGLFYPSYMIWLMLCATSVATSRVVLGMHFVSDVIAGSVMGAGIGYMAYSLVS
jgi:undecaprenyl-diphosphatase